MYVNVKLERVWNLVSELARSGSIRIYRDFTTCVVVFTKLYFFSSYSALFRLKLSRRNSLSSFQLVHLKITNIPNKNTVFVAGGGDEINTFSHSLSLLLQSILTDATKASFNIIEKMRAKRCIRSIYTHK